MKFTRRTALATLAAGFPAIHLRAASAAVRSFESTWDSLRQYQCPEWLRDAKFGIWAHWGPQCVPQTGNWYARNMYIEGTPQYEYHVKNYRHPSKIG